MTTLQAQICEWGHPKYSRKQIFQVVLPCDLSVLPQMLMPQTIHTGRHVKHKLMHNTTKFVGAKIHVASSAAVPGDWIHAQIHVDNQLGHVIKLVQVWMWSQTKGQRSNHSSG